MNQYSFKNQAYLIQQNPSVTEVHPFSYWKENGRRVKKGEKALKVWIPKAGKDRKEAADADEQSMHIYFRQGSVFDISQTETQEEYDRRKEQEAAGTIATADGVIVAEYRHVDIA
jgi:hypothetical protein